MQRSAAAAATAVVTAGIRGAARISPGLAARAALPLFFRPMSRMTIGASGPGAAEVEEFAERGTLRVGGAELASYRWGAGSRTVLLMHGWGGRAAQFGSLVPRLTAAGLTVVAFDAPGHGSSRGSRADLRDWVAAARELSAGNGGFDAIVGHSLGGLAALAAAREAVPVRALAVISAAATPLTLIDAFAGDLRLGAATRERFLAGFLREFGETPASLVERYDAAAHPLPPPTRLLVVHDRGDRRVPDVDALRLHAAHGSASRIVRTEGLGHTKLLGDPAVLSEVTRFVVDPAGPVGSAGSGG